MLIAQGGFRLGRSTVDQKFALQQIFKKSWEYAKEVNACLVGPEKAYDRISERQALGGVVTVWH